MTPKFKDLLLSLKTYLRSMGISQEEVIIAGSGILGALGIREPKDLDVVIPEERTFKKVIRWNNDGAKIWSPGGQIEFHHGPWMVWGINFALAENLTSLVEYPKLRFWSLDKLLRFKMGLARPKDALDVALIDRYRLQHPDRG